MDTSVQPVPKIYFWKEISMLKLFGVSILGNDSIPYKIYSAIFVMGTVFLYSIMNTYECFKQGFNDLIIYQIVGCITICEVTVVFLNRDKLTNLLGKLEQEPFLGNPKRGGDKEQELIDECIWITKLQTYTYWIVATVSISSTIIYGLVKYVVWDDRTLPYGSLTILNPTYSLNYDIIYVYQCVSVIFIAFLLSSIELLLAAVLAHLCYQFKILQNNVQKLTKICYREIRENAEISQNLNLCDGSDNSAIPWMYLKTALKEAVQYHSAIIDIATELEKVFNNLFLIVFLGTLAFLSFSIYWAAAVGSNLQVVLRHLFEGSCACMQVGIVCYWGEQVMHESQQVGQFVIESNFDGTDLRYQKMLTFIIRRSQNPTKFTAGKFTVICLATFAWFLRTSYSSFMFLRQANGNLA